MENKFYRGEIYFIAESRDYKELGSAQGGGRPAVIVSNDIGNEAGPIVEIVYLTTRDKKPLPTHVKIMSAKLPSTALCENVTTVYKDKIGRYIGQCSVSEMKKIDEALAVSLGLGLNIKSNALVEKWRDAVVEEPADSKEEVSVKIPEPKTCIVEKEVVVSDIELQIKLAKAEAERDVYKKLYEEAMKRKAV